MMNQNLAIIFGATGGVGSASARELHRQGWKLLLVSRTEDDLQALARELNCPYQRADVTKSSDVERVFEEAKAIPRAHTAIIHAVGSILLKPAHLLTDEEFHQVLSLNLYSAFFVLREAIKQRASETMNMVFFSSAAGTLGLRNHEAIASAKAGIVGLTKSAAATYAKQGIRINTIAPGLLDTKLAERITKNSASLAASEAMHPVGRIGTPEEVGRLVTWLASPEQSWITGQTIGMDGGLASLKT